MRKNVIRDIRKDTASGKQMNRLLQGDVGSGKTMVALLSMLIAADNGFQSVMMAPDGNTGSAALQQHFDLSRRTSCSGRATDRFYARKGT